MKGLLDTIDRCRPILLVERTGGTDAITELLAPFGYAPFVYRRAERRFAPYSGEANTNVFFLPDHEQPGASSFAADHD